MVQFDVKRVSKGTENFMVSFDFTKTPVTQVADYIIIAASKNNASDIHFDPRENGMMVRFRIDGDLRDYTFIPKAYERNLTTRLKLLANLNITESRLPQDGAIKGTFGDKYLDMRASDLPLNEGEKIVIRILDYTRSLQGIDSLGFNSKNIVKIKRMIGIPNGIILVTGATGSGKSTTTYSMLQALNKPEINVITVEDPIEMNIEGINQVQVNAEIGMTFAAALRSILRQDPNVILIGEIRDSETAQIAVRSAITGHLVLSTIHTNNSLSTIERLLDMDVERYLLSTALVGIISQRLAKSLCPDCRIQREATPYEKKVFKLFMNTDVGMIWDANPKGCDHCRKGYKGRIAIQEVLELDDDLRSAINKNNITKEELSKMVYTDKTITLLQDGLGKILTGDTSFEEVYRVIEIETGDAGEDALYGQTLTQSLEKQVEQPSETINNSGSLIEETNNITTNSIREGSANVSAAAVSNATPTPPNNTGSVMATATNTSNATDVANPIKPPVVKINTAPKEVVSNPIPEVGDVKSTDNDSSLVVPQMDFNIPSILRQPAAGTQQTQPQQPTPTAPATVPSVLQQNK